MFELYCICLGGKNCLILVLYLEWWVRALVKHLWFLKDEILLTGFHFEADCICLFRTKIAEVIWNCWMRTLMRPCMSILYTKVWSLCNAFHFEEGNIYLFIYFKACLMLPLSSEYRSSGWNGWFWRGKDGIVFFFLVWYFFSPSFWKWDCISLRHRLLNCLPNDAIWS